MFSHRTRTLIFAFLLYSFELLSYFNSFVGPENLLEPDKTGSTRKYEGRAASRQPHYSESEREHNAARIQVGLRRDASLVPKLAPD